MSDIFFAIQLRDVLLPAIEAMAEKERAHLQWLHTRRLVPGSSAFIERSRRDLLYYETRIADYRQSVKEHGLERVEEKEAKEGS